MKELWLFTSRYPYGLREAFIENEIKILCDRFDRVRVFPEHIDTHIRPMPPNAELCSPITDPFKAASLGVVLRSTKLLWPLLRSLWVDKPSIFTLLKHWSVLRSRMAQFINRAALLRNGLMAEYDPERVVVYSYWTHDWVTVLGLLREDDPRLTFFSRAHGYDIFEEQNVDHWIPFRAFQLEHVQRVHCASRTGMEHLRQRHPKRKELFQLAHLGTSDHGPGPFDPSGPLRIASCSFLIPRKRVLLLVEALSRMRIPVSWTHFGGGVEQPLVEEAVARLPENIQVDLRGMTANAEIIAWYQHQPVDVFVHLSSLEGGVAVAVQEAASFGIPVVVTDSGGVRDIVDQRTGVLLANEVRPEELARLLGGFRESEMATSSFRSGVREAWREGFEANRIFHRFVDQVLLDHAKDRGDR